MIPPFLLAVPIIGILRFVPPDVALPAAGAAARGGIRAMEVTLNSVDPLDLLRSMRDELPDVAIGAGTVMSEDDAQSAITAGAQFIVCPHLDEALIRYCVDAGVPVFPGAYTPTEVWNAHRAGATMVKLFPASHGGPEYVRALRGPLPQIDLLVTGGVDANNIGAFMAAGANGAAIGGRLFSKDVLERGAVEEEATKLVEACRAS